MNEELLKKDKKILKLHLIYWAVIFALLSVFLLCIAPGKVNESAFENFSFTSSIVSIVLAVVSIVFSFKTKSTTSDNIAGIREIERSIDSKLQKFDSLKTEIVEEVKGITRPIEDDVNSIRQGQVETSNKMQELFEKMAQRSAGTNETNGQLLSSASFFGNVMMYVLCKAKQSGKVIDMNKMGLDFNDNYDYFWGFWVALTALKGRPFDYEDKKRIITVTKYDESQLGDMSYWESKINGFKDKEEVKKYLDAVNTYFSTNNNTSEGEE